MAELAALQRQFYDRVTAGVPADGLISSGAIEIYANMYYARLHDAIADDYPKLRATIGEDAFHALMSGYLRAHPPRSFTLRDAGLALPEFLRTWSSAPAWAPELAALERARVEVFDGPDATPLTQDEVMALDAALPELVLRWVPSSVVVPLTWDVDELWSALEDGQPAPTPAPGARVVLVWRRDAAVLHRTLDADEGALAAALVEGAAFSDVCERLADAHGDDAGPRAAELLLRWLTAAAVRAPDAAPDGALDADRPDHPDTAAATEPQ